jgi:transposase
MATRAEWSARVKKWKRSGLAVEEFARREGIDAKLLGWWRWKLGSTQIAASVIAPEPRFLPVHVMASQSPPAATPIEIVLRNGWVVRVSPGFDAATLERVLAVTGTEGEAAC